MDIFDVAEKTRALLQKQGRVSYRILKRQLALDEDALCDLKFELIGAQRVAADGEGTSQKSPSMPPENPRIVMYRRAW